MGNLVRQDLARLSFFQPPAPVPGAINLVTNEMPYEPPPSVVAAITEAARSLRRYPDIEAVALRTALANRYGVSADRIATGCGSMALLEHLIKATCRPGDQVICAWRSFDVYPVMAISAGVAATLVPNTADHRHDLEAMAAAVSDRTRLILICSPNNPTGAVVRRAELDAFLDTVRPDVLVALDEAYYEFVTDPEAVDGIRDYRDRPNLVVLRTFSKAWGIAGLRLGYLVGSAEVVKVVRLVTTLWSSSAVAQAAALAALGAEDEMRDRVQRVVRERERVLAAVRAMVSDVPDSHGNFIWLPVGARARELAQACERRNVLVRAVDGHGLRVTIGTPDQNDAFLHAFTDALTDALRPDGPARVEIGSNPVAPVAVPIV